MSESPSQTNEFVTLYPDDLFAVLECNVENHTPEEVNPTIEDIKNFFGYSERTINNILGSEGRDAFYGLENAGLPDRKKEDETTLYDGKEWRIHYWLFKKENMLKLPEDCHKTNLSDEDTENVYAHILKNFEKP